MMKTKLLISSTPIFFLFILLMSVVSAPMPVSHKYLTAEVLKGQYNDELYKSCLKFPSLCYAGATLTDFSVTAYWIDQMKYDLSHASSFARAMLEEAKTPEEEACSAGVFMHQANDWNSHNIMVPYSIKHTGLTNYLIHVFAEEKIDLYVQENYPGVKQEALLQLNDYQKCVPLFKRVLLGSKEYSDTSSQKLDDIFAKFITEVQTSNTGYDTAFKTKSFMVNIKALPFAFIGTYLVIMMSFALLFILLLVKISRRNAKIRHYIAIIIFGILASIFVYIFVMNLQGRGFEAIMHIVNPISRLVPIGDTPQNYLDEAVKNTQNMFNEGTTWLNGKDASGLGLYGTGQLGALNLADRSVLKIDYFIFFFIVVLFVWYIWYLFKRNKIRVQNEFNL